MDNIAPGDRQLLRLQLTVNAQYDSNYVKPSPLHIRDAIRTLNTIVRGRGTVGFVAMSRTNVLCVRIAARM